MKNHSESVDLSASWCVETGVESIIDSLADGEVAVLSDQPWEPLDTCPEYVAAFTERLIASGGLDRFLAPRRVGSGSSS